ncbi:MAG: hypothetical protein HYV97_15625 [Bdellovibrio sp.]|nr:hypothetical protein [Bdellovibrio sp.]
MLKGLVIILSVLFFTSLHAKAPVIKKQMTCVAHLNSQKVGEMEIPLDKTAQMKNIYFSGKNHEKFYARLGVELVQGVLNDDPEAWIGTTDSDSKPTTPFAVTNLRLPFESGRAYALNQHYNLSYVTANNQIYMSCEYTRTTTK